MCIRDRFWQVVDAEPPDLKGLQLVRWLLCAGGLTEEEQFVDAVRQFGCVSASVTVPAPDQLHHPGLAVGGSLSGFGVCRGAFAGELLCWRAGVFSVEFGGKRRVSMVGQYPLELPAVHSSGGEFRQVVDAEPPDLKGLQLVRWLSLIHI